MYSILYYFISVNFFLLVLFSFILYFFSSSSLLSSSTGLSLERKNKVDLVKCYLYLA